MPLNSQNYHQTNVTTMLRDKIQSIFTVEAIFRKLRYNIVIVAEEYYSRPLPQILFILGCGSVCFAFAFGMVWYVV
jgi:hypothetical protein